MKNFVRIRNQRELEKFQKVNMAQEDCDLVRKVLITDGSNFNKEILDSLSCEDKTNLLTIQFETNAQKENFTFERAKELINLQKNVKNKILLVPVESSLVEFKQLQDMFGGAEHTISLFPEMEDKDIIAILDYCIGSHEVISIEFLERDSKDYVEKVFRFGILYSEYFNMGLTDIKLNSHEKYGGTTPELYYATAGYKYFTKKIFLHGGPGKIKRFNPDSFKYEVISEKEKESFKSIYGSKWLDALYCQNLLGIHNTISGFSSMTKEEIQTELAKKGINFSFTNIG